MESYLLKTLKKGTLASIIGVISVSLVGCSGQQHHTMHHHKSRFVAKHTVNKLRPKANYQLSSERAPYPKLSKSNEVVVNLAKQRAYIKAPIYKTHHKISRYKTVYTMFVSTGSHNRTPRGVYHINNVRTPWFYSQKEHEGAQYAVGWHDGGVYLFHATPSNRHKHIYKNVAKQLGKKPSSHGCIHLTIPDAKWFSTHAVTGMKVIIK